MPEITIVDANTIRIHVELKDAIFMVQEAAENLEDYAAEIVTIYEKMPVFEYVHFCFYAFDSARLFEKMLGDTDPKNFTSFSLDAPDAFFYSLYGGMSGLYEQAKQIAG